jgi:uncharacterized repeat protein (TIGR03803 family)
MKTGSAVVAVLIRKFLLLCIVLLFCGALTVPCYGETILHFFTGAPNDGDRPFGDLTLSDSTLYGTTGNGGSSSNAGTVFSINTDGSNYKILHSFAGAPSDGSKPAADLTLSGSTLYGTTGEGGSSGRGTVFSINTDGSNYKVLYSFAGSNDGRTPLAGLTLSDSTLYGTTNEGGTSDVGTIFSINTDGSNYRVLHSFARASNDGIGPRADLALSGATLYGTTNEGGTSDVGTIFSINTDGSNYRVLYSFAGGSNDGVYPQGLTFSGSTLYGTTNAGGGSNAGTIFSFSMVTLEVAKSGSGTGRVTSNPPGIDCGDLCSASYMKDTSVTLTATAASESIFSGWSGNCGGTGTCTVAMSDHESVGAEFDKRPCAYTISTAGKSFTRAAGSTRVTVIAKGANICPDPDFSISDTWIGATLTSFKNNRGSVKVTVQVNDTSSTRTGTVTIAGQILHITQAGAPCAITISPRSHTLLSSGGPGSFSVTAPTGCAWSAEVAAASTPWLSISSGATGNGNGTVAYDAQSNATKKQRVGKINVCLTEPPARKKVFTLTEKK